MKRPAAIEGHEALRAAAMFGIIAAVVAAVVIAIYVGAIIEAGRALGQEHHERHHAFYQNWTNKKGEGCCNNQDCGELADHNEREVAGRIEVRIEGQWCPVLPGHYLKSGNAPNWQTAHVCVVVRYPAEEGGTDPRGPCERLLCYQPKPLF